MLFVCGSARFFFSFALLFDQTGGFCLFLAAALGGNGFFFFAARTLFGFLLLAFRTLFRFNALAFRQFSTCFLFSFTARCGFNLSFVLRFGISAGTFSCFPSNIFLTFQSSFFFRFFTKALKLCSFMLTLLCDDQCSFKLLDGGVFSHSSFSRYFLPAFIKCNSFCRLNALLDFN